MITPVLQYSSPSRPSCVRASTSTYSLTHTHTSIYHSSIPGLFFYSSPLPPDAIPSTKGISSLLETVFPYHYLIKWTDLHRLNVVNLPSPRPPRSWSFELSAKRVRGFSLSLLLCAHLCSSASDRCSHTPNGVPSPILFWLDFPFYCIVPVSWVSMISLPSSPPHTLLLHLHLLDIFLPSNYSVTPYFSEASCSTLILHIRMMSLALN